MGFLELDRVLNVGPRKRARLSARPCGPLAPACPSIRPPAPAPVRASVRSSARPRVRPLARLFVGQSAHPSARPPLRLLVRSSIRYKTLCSCAHCFAPIRQCSHCRICPRARLTHLPNKAVSETDARQTTKNTSPMTKMIKIKLEGDQPRTGRL